MAKRPSIPNVDFESTGDRARRAASSSGAVASPINLAPIPQSSPLDGFTKAADGLQRIVDGIQITRDRVKAVQAETKAQTDAVAKTAELDPLAPDYGDRVKAIWDDTTRSAKENAGITNSDIQADFDNRMAQLSAAAQVSAIGIKKEAVSKEAIRVYGDSADAAVAKIRSDPANASIYIKEFQGDEDRLKQGIDPRALGGLKDKFQNATIAAQVAGFADKGNLGAAKKALNDQHGALDNGQYTTLSNYIDGKQRHFEAEANKFRTEQLAGVLTDFNDKAAGNKPWDGNERQKIDDMKAKGLLGPEQYHSAVSYLNQAQAKDKVEQAKNVEAVTALQNGFSFKNQEQADRAFKMTVGQIPFSALAYRGSADDWTKASAVATSISEHGQYVPTDIKDLLASADSTTDKNSAQFVGRAAQLADDMSPRAKSGLDLKSDGSLAIVRGEAKRLIQQGIPKDQAYLQAAQTQLSKGPLTIQEEKDRAEVARKALDKQGYVDGIVKKTFDQGLFTSNPAIDDAVQRTFREAYQSAQSSDPATREAVAVDALKKTWGISEVGGTKQLTKYPPEQYLPQSARTLLTPFEQGKVINDDIEKALNGVNVPFNKNKDLPGLTPYRLMADDQTAADVRAGRSPRFTIQVLRGDHYESIPGLPSYVVPQKLEGVPLFDKAMQENERQGRDARASYLGGQAQGDAKENIRQRQKSAISDSVKALQK